MNDDERLNAISRVLGSISEEQWQAMAKGVLRKVASGEGDVSDETRVFAREVLADMDEGKVGDK